MKTEHLSHYVWFEFWTEWWLDQQHTPYVLVLGCKAPDEFEIYDPIAESVPFTCRSFEEARNWLCEDEYSQVKGRVQVETE